MLLSSQVFVGSSHLKGQLIVYYFLYRTLRRIGEIDRESNTIERRIEPFEPSDRSKPQKNMSQNLLSRFIPVSMRFLTPTLILGSVRFRDYFLFNFFGKITILMLIFFPL